MVTRIFTFGMGQKLEGYGSLRDHYVEIEGDTAEHCRMIMLNHFGQKWAFEYADKECARVDEFNMTELPCELWPVSSGQFYVDDRGLVRVQD